MEISYAGFKRRKVILIQTQNPKSKIQTAPFGAAAKRTKTKLIQNPKSKLQNPRSKIQNPNSKIQTPKSKRPVWILELDFGFGRAGTGGDGYVANDDVWPCWPPEFSWRLTSLQPKGSRLGSPHARPKLGTDFRRRGFAGNRAPISGPVSWKSGPNFRRNSGPGGAAQNVRSASRGADHVCKCKGCQHHVASTMCANARDVNIA